MLKKPSLWLAAAVSALLVGGWPLLAQESEFSFEVPQSFLDLRFPNGGAKTITVPTGWGAAFGSVFAGGGFTDRVPHSDAADGGISAGVGLWDPILYVGVQASVAVSDLSEFSNFSAGIKVHRDVGSGWSIAVGAENLFVEEEETDLDSQSYYVAASHTFQGFGRAGVGRLYLTVGAGTGRFADKSPIDVRAGNGEDASVVFGSLAVEVFEGANLIGEWNANNLAVGAGFTIPNDVLPVSFTLALVDLTDNSGDGTRFIANGGFGLSVF